MTGKTHKIGGLTAGIITTTLLFDNPFEKSTLLIGIPLVICAIFGSLLPDLDHPGSTLGKKVPFISSPLSHLFGHRGFIHSPLLCLIIGVLLLSFYPTIPATYKSIYLGVTLGITVGYASHLFLDALTVSGVPLLSPISRKKYRLMKLHTGKHEWFVIITLTIITTAIVTHQWF